MHKVVCPKGGTAERSTILDIAVPKKVGIRKLQNYHCNFLNTEILEYKESSKPALFCLMQYMKR
jgi:hypothetical protein